MSGLPSNWHLARATALGGAVAALGAFRDIAVQLDELRVIDMAAERAFDGFEVSLVSLGPLGIRVALRVRLYFRHP
jgi:hypothetical protein